MDSLNTNYTNEYKKLLSEISDIGVTLYRELTIASPVGISGELQRSWTIDTPTEANPVLSISTNSQYALAVEVGRRPGSGISARGQESVALWGRRKLSLTPSQAQSMAFALSQKYKREGRPAQANWGLVPEGSIGQTIPQSLRDTQRGSIIHNAYKQLSALTSG